MSSKLKPLASKGYFFEILMDFGKLVFFMFVGAGNRRANKLKKHVVKHRAAVDANHNPAWLIKLRFWPDSTFSCLTKPDTGRF